MIYKKLLFTVFLALYTLIIPISSSAAPLPPKPLENVSDFIASVNASANNPASVSEAPVAAGLSAGGKAESEILLSVSVELSTDPGNPTGFAARAARTNWFKAGDLTEATLRISNLRRELLEAFHTVGLLQLASGDATCANCIANQPLGVWRNFTRHQYHRCEAIYF